MIICSRRLNLTTFFSISVFLFYSMTLSVPSGYSYGSVLTLLISLYALNVSPRTTLSNEDYIIIYALFSVFIFSLISLLLHKEKLNTLDQASRYLLAIPIFLSMLKHPYRLGYLWGGLIVGSISAAVIARWQVEWLGLDRATGFVTSAIPFGNIGLVMGILCAAGLFWASTQGPLAVYWRIGLTVGLVSGLYCSIASLSRGGWLAILPVLFLFGAASLTKINLRKVSLVSVALVLILSGLFLIPKTGVQARYEQAIQGITNYLHKNDVNSSAGERLEAWRTALTINIPRRPFFGWGHEEHKQQLELLAFEGKIDPLVATLANTHNNYLEAWLFQGIFGLLSLLAVFLFPFWFFCKRLRSQDLIIKSLSLSGASLIASFFVFCMTQVILGRNNGVIFFVMTLVIFWSSMRNREIVLNHNN